MEEKRPLRRQPDNRHLARSSCSCHGQRLPAGNLGSNEGALLTPSRISNPLKSDWQRHVVASSGYLELGMFDATALVLEEIAPEEKTRNEVLGARVNLYMAAKKWDMAAAVARHLVKVDPENPGAWINLAYSVRRAENIEQAEAVLLKARALHPKDAWIAFNIAWSKIPKLGVRSFPSG